MTKIRYVLILIFLINTNYCYSQQEKLIIEHFDVASGEVTSSGPVRILTGNVHLRQGDAELFCQKVRWFVNKHEIILDKDVKYIDSEKSLTADIFFYDDLNRIVKARGHVIVVDSVHELNSKKATYYENEDRIVADDDVILIDDENVITLTGQHAEYLREDNYAVVTGNPVLIKKDSTGKEEIRILGEKMELLGGGKKAIVTDSVEIIHDNGNATCQLAEFYKDENRILLKNEPVMWQKHDRLSGEEIELFFVNRELHKVNITNNALVTSLADTNDVDGKVNQLLGNNMTLLIADRKLNEVIVEGKATSYYHIIDEKTKEYKGLNKVIGDKITMKFLNNEIKHIDIKSNPGSSEGIYYPPEVKRPDLNLKEF